MALRIRYSPRVTIIGLILIAGMLTAAHWQWRRHLYKLDYIKQMEARLAAEPAPLETLIPALNQNPENAIYRRVLVDGTYDYEHEMVLRNRRFDDIAGVHVLTPLKLNNSSDYILVDRGFVPLGESKPEARTQFRGQSPSKFVGLLKETAHRKMFAPRDPPTGQDQPWVDAWLRVDLPQIAKQLPYPILPAYLETVEGEDVKGMKEQIVTSGGGREDLLFLGLKEIESKASVNAKGHKFPVPMFDPVIPAGRHLGYVFEWASMAAMTFLICLVLQLKRPKKPATEQAGESANPA